MLGCLFLAACTGTRNLPKGEKLYTGAEIKLETTEKINKKVIKTVVESGVRPAQNKKILGMRPKLWMYNTAGENPKTKLKKWLKKMGEAPVLMRHVKPGVSSAIIDAKLFNIGIFKSFTASEIIEKRHTFKVIYTSHVHKPFVVKNLICDIPDDSLSRLILTSKDKSIIKAGEDYNLDKLRIERIRIDGLLKNNGYFYFNPDYLLFNADTSNINRDVTFKLTLKDSIPQDAKTVYRINNVCMSIRTIH
jgi:outer membrane protein insertion porin family